MLWQRDKQTGTQSCRPSGGSGITKRNVTQAFRNSGFQSGTVSVSYFRRLSDWLQDYEALLLALIPLNFANEQLGSGAPRPWIALPWESSGLAGNVSLNTGPSVTVSYLQSRPLPGVILLYSYSPPASQSSLCTDKSPASLTLYLNLSMKTCLSFHCCHSPLSACLTDLKIGNGHICTEV